IIRHGIRVRILLSKDTYVDKTMNALQLRCKNQSDLIQYRYIEQMQGTKSTIVIVDRNVSLLMEVKDDKKQNFLEAIGLSTYLNSKAGILSYISIFENLWRITELLEELSLANLKLQKQDVLQKEFVHIAAHELRNPIQPIIALSQFLKGYVDKYYKEQNDVLDVIYRNSKRLERLSEDILDITRIESNTIHIKKEEFNLDIFLENVVSDYQYTLRKFPTSLDNEDIISIKFLPLTTDLKIVEWDKEKLNQVVFNLLDNACRFSMENNAKTGEVNVTCETFKDYALVKIIDNGPGIDPEVLPKIFTKFASKSKNGTGLGLFICKNLIESFGGKIWVQSSYTMQKQDNISKDIYPFNHLNEDKGTTIVFSIPLNLKINNNHKTNIIDNNQKSKNHNNKPRKILILDDESDLTITYRIGLESIGFKVDAYNDPIEALSKFIPNYYDLLLLDIRMPKMNGLEFYTCIKK
ncbi:MAG TPA: hybrid sensor histidine kinase/response regulator, partial [Verrucomicrobiae bacterium]|nr:hybrid sensor histidine kinase/response regulator [Verrucomicrobiae bacterium]